jgi:hypothetical protein
MGNGGTNGHKPSIFMLTLPRGRARGWASKQSDNAKGNEMNIDDLTMGQVRELVTMFGNSIAMPPPDMQMGPPRVTPTHRPRQVIVCTDKSGVIFGTTEDMSSRPIVLTDARMCIYWSADVGGVFGLADIGPTPGCRISAALPEISLDGVTAIMGMTDIAISAWRAAPVQGR